MATKKPATKKSATPKPAAAKTAAADQQPRIRLAVIYNPGESNKELKQQPHAAIITNVLGTADNAVSLQVLPDTITAMQYHGNVPHASKATPGAANWDFDY